MKQEITFMPLGGGQRVGASCYHLRIGEANIILDAGTGKENGMEFVPDFHSFLTLPFVYSMNQISQIFISHAHSDHVGYLLKLMKQAGYASVYMTELTKLLTEFQLYDRCLMEGKTKGEDRRLAAKSLLEKIAVVSYMQTMDFGAYKTSFFPAGHIPGAMMTLFEVGKRNILYTGDYSLDGTGLTPGCIIPDGIEIDTVIMCGLHAKHPNYIKKSDTLYKQAHYVLYCAQKKRQSVLCYIPQLSKGLEFLKTVNDCNKAGAPVYLDNSVMNMVTKMERLSVPVLSPYNKVVGESLPNGPHIYLTSNQAHNGTLYDKSLKIDFSLHEDFSEMKQFLKKINAKQAVIVHCGKEESVYGKTIEQEMMHDGECRTQFIFAEEKEIYKL